MYDHFIKEFNQKSKLPPSLSQFLNFCSNQNQQSKINLCNWQSIVHIDRIKAKQHYICFPEYIYNTAFGSLLTNHACKNQTVGIDSNESNTDINQYFEKIPYKINDNSLPSSQICNNSACNDNHTLHQQSIYDIIKILIDFLSEFLLFLSSIIENNSSYSKCQLEKIAYIAEHIYELRLLLINQINNINESMTNSTILDISSISLILYELASFIQCLGKEYQQIETIIENSQTTIFTELLDHLEKIIKSCMNSINIDTNSQNLQISIPTMYPCLNSSPIIDNSLLMTEGLFPCNESNMCVPWLLYEQMKYYDEGENNFGLIYGIKDENIRRKLGYGTREHKSPYRTKQTFHKYKLNDFSNEQYVIDSNGKWIISSIDDDQIPVIEQISETRRKSGRISPNSIISQEMNTTNRLGSSYTISRQQPIVNSKQSSRLFNDRFILSNSSGHITSSQTEDFHRTSKADHRQQHYSSSRLNQQQSNIYKQNDDKTSLWTPLSFEKDGHRIPSKTSFKLSHKNTSINDIRDNKSISNNLQINDKESINQSPISYQIHIDNIDSSDTFTSHDKIQRMHSTHSKQNINSPISDSQLSINDSESNFNYDDNSGYHMSPSTNFHNETNDNTSQLKIIEGPQSTIGEIKTINTLNNDKKYMSTSHSDDSSLLIKTKEQKNEKQLFQSMTGKEKKLYTQKTSNIPLESKEKKYIHKFLNCFRRTTVKRIN